MRIVFLTPIPPLFFEPYCVSYDSCHLSLSPLVHVVPIPINPPDYIVGVAKGRVIVLVDLLSPEPDKPFLDFCERIAIGHGADTNDLEIRH